MNKPPADHNNPRPRSLANQISKFFLIALLVGAPVVSYFYLQSGIDYRKESLAGLQPKTIGAALTTYINSDLSKNGKAKLLRLNTTESGIDRMIANIDQRIVQKEFFEILEIESGSSLDADHDLVLLDTSHVVRAVYNYNDDLGKQLIRDLSVVIPMAPKKKLKLERDQKE